MEVYLFEGVDEQDPVIEDKEVKAISLAAIAGVQPCTGQTLRLPVYNNKENVGGPARLRVCEQTSLLNVSWLKQPCNTGLYATVANGDRINSTGVCRALAISIANDTYLVDC